jgi:hypothetical protein
MIIVMIILYILYYSYIVLCVVTFYDSNISPKDLCLLECYAALTGAYYRILKLVVSSSGSSSPSREVSFDCLTLNIKALHPSETSGTVYQSTHPHVLLEFSSDDS